MEKNITTTTTTTMSLVPSFGDDICYEILTRVPKKSLRRFKLVSKRWRSIIEHQLKPPQNGVTLLIHPLGIPPKHAGIVPILFEVEDLNLGGKVSPLNVDLGRPNDRIHMLKPVNGLICFVEGASVLIFNPYTREKSSWIETTTSAKVGQKRKDYETMEAVEYKYSFGFGFDETRKKHKVVCICEIYTKTRSQENPQPDSRVCEVLTVGENTWRKIDKDVPSHNVDGESLYVNGFVYWRDENEPQPNVIVAFDVGREKFGVVEIDCNLKAHWRHVIQQSVPLVEFDGCMGVLDGVIDTCIKYWISPDDVDKIHCDWSHYTVSKPLRPWTGEGYLAFSATTDETELVILLSFDKSIRHQKRCYYFNQLADKYMKVEINEMSPFVIPKLGYEIRTVSQCLLPVQ